MSIIEIIIIAVVLSLDALAVSVSYGMVHSHSRSGAAAKVSFFFGSFQGIMPLLGWWIGSYFSNKFDKFSFVITFIIFLLLGIKMIHEGLNPKDEDMSKYGTKVLLLLALATSIDAFAIGINFALMTNFRFINVLFASIIIALVTAILCFCGFFVGNKLKHILEGKAEIIGGVVMILFAIKTLFSALH